MDFLADLNEAQREAVLRTDGPLLVLAGAGSGKTRVLTYRVAYLVGEKNTRNVLAVTFTNKAAGEMRSRVQKLLNHSVEGLWVSTFHSMGNRMLRRDIDKIGLSKDFTIYDSDDSRALIKECMKTLNLDITTYNPNTIRWKISIAKNDGVLPSEFAAQAMGPIERRHAEIYEMYEKRLRELNALDFDDLILLPAKLLTECEESREEYRDMFRYILVDEFQDTNAAQYELLKLLTGPEKNICVVGDEDQSIYMWRGARLDNIINFTTDFKGAGIVRLEENYRSTNNILKAASALVENNSKRIGKTLRSSRGKGDKIGIFVGQDEKEEAEMIYFVLQDLKAKKNLKNRDFSVFYRTHAQSRSIEDVLRRTNTPYAIIGGMKFYDRKEVKDIMAYMKLAVNPLDLVSFKRAVNTPPRGIGPAAISTIDAHYRAGSGNIINAARFAAEDEETKNRTRKAITVFLNIMGQIGAMKDTIKVSEMISLAIENSGYLQWLEKDKSPESVARQENLDELVRAAEDYERERHPDVGPTLSGFLDRVSLLTNVDIYSDENDRITLMTLHTAKGLEFPVVFIVGMEEDLFPHIMSKTSLEEMEEERRLFYVGMTRAMDNLFLLRAKYRRYGDSWRDNIPSRFLAEIPNEYAENISQGAFLDTFSTKPDESGETVYDYSMGQPDSTQKFSKKF